VVRPPEAYGNTTLMLYATEQSTIAVQ
jgi:hypothetical protein